MAYGSLTKAPTDELIKLYDHVQGMLLIALTKSDKTSCVQKRSRQVERSAEFSEQLYLFLNELTSRSSKGDTAALRFVGNVDASLIYRAAG